MVKEIPLTQGKVALVDDDDYQTLKKFKWYPQRSGTSLYAVSSYKGTSIRMHRVILNLETKGLGLSSRNYHVHHLDGDGLNNQKSNLKLLTAMEHRLIHSYYISHESDFLKSNIKESWVRIG